MQKRVLITGGAGFIGSHLCEQLQKEEIELTIIDDFSSGSLHNVPSGVNVIESDVKNYSGKLFDLIYHLSAKIDAREQTQYLFDENIEQTKSAIKLLSKNGHFVLASTCGVYGNSKNANEDDTLNPFGLYSWSKYISESLVKTCPHWTIFRFGNVFGERQNRKSGIIAIIEESLKKNVKIKLFNGGKSYRDFVYVKDVVRALSIPMDKQVFNIGTGYPTKIIDLVKKSGVEYEHALYQNEISYIKLNTDKIRNCYWQKSDMTALKYIDLIRNA